MKVFGQKALSAASRLWVPKARGLNPGWEDSRFLQDCCYRGAEGDIPYVTTSPWGAFACLGFIRSKKSIKSKAMCKYAQVHLALFSPEGCGGGRQAVVPPDFFPPVFLNTLMLRELFSGWYTTCSAPHSFSSSSVSFHLRSWPEGLEFASEWAPNLLPLRMANVPVLLWQCQKWALHIQDVF